MQGQLLELEVSIQVDQSVKLTNRCARARVCVRVCVLERYKHFNHDNWNAKYLHSLYF